MSDTHSGTAQRGLSSAEGASVLSRLEKQLLTLLSIIAGMVDLTGFVTLGNVFTAHITGNVVVIGAWVVRRGRINPTQILAIPVFILAVAAVWLLARASGRRGPSLLRLLLLIQFLILTCVLIFSIITKPSANPHGLMADVAAMMAVSAVACQFALLRLALPVPLSTAVMTGNLTTVVLSLLDRMSQSEPPKASDKARLRSSLILLIGFFAGCVVAAAAEKYLGEWAWSFPAVLAGIAVVLR